MNKSISQQNLFHSSLFIRTSSPISLLCKITKDNHTKSTVLIMSIQSGRSEGGGGEGNYKSILCTVPASDLINPGET